MTKITNLDKCCRVFSEENFYDLFKEDNNNYHLETKEQLNYLVKYLNEIHCKQILVEDYYIDKYYLDDYIHYYATCTISNYSNSCKRIHFFSKRFESNKLLEPSNIEVIKKKYLGFIVKKPIPDAFIGRTILNTYPETNESIEQGYLTGKRHILSLKEYSANIFGANFAINSLVFQEQDSIISDCATTALWTVLQKAGSKFGYYSPSPYEIKISASEHYGRIRPLPASGLNLLQIIEAIKSFNMEYQVKDYTEEGIEADRLTFLNFCYSYLRGGLPIFLGVNIEDDYHALAILGYHLSSEKNITESLPFLGCKIDKLYLHDDNIGPFVRAKVNNDSEENLVLNYEGKEMIPQSVIIPIYHKIRYPTTEIYEYINEFHNLLIQILQEKVGLEWDCYITTVNQYKNEILKNSNYEVYPQEKKKKILSEFMPKYLWRCILRIDDMILLDLLADATEARINNPFFFITCNSETLTEELRERLGDWVKKSYFSKSGFAEFLYERFSL